MIRGRKEVVSWSHAQRAEIAEEMERVLSDPRFNSSKHCSRLLRYLVEYALQGNDHNAVKERTLGIEVFGRNSDYDSSSDPVVRTTASEIRRRLARHYQESAGPRAVKIRLVPGSYFPQFDFEEEADDPVEEVLAPAQALPAPPLPFWLNWKPWSVFVAVVLAAILILTQSDSLRSTGYLIWKPLLASKGNLTLCVSHDGPGLDSPENTTTPDRSHVGLTMPFVDATVAQKLSIHLAELGEIALMRRYDEVSLRNFRAGPTVLIGAAGDPWLPKLLPALRYSVRHDPDLSETWIQDDQNPASRPWKIPSGRDAGSLTVDYAIITRVRSPETGGWIMALAGLSSSGTKAACDLLTDDSFEKSLPRTLRSQKNFQIVLKTSVFNGIIGSPQVLAVYTW